jgi:L-cysteine S-thiosulfotransferase
VKTAHTLLAAFLLSAAFTAAARSGDGLRAYVIIGDAIPRPLTGEPGDAARGRAIVTNR